MNSALAEYTGRKTTTVNYCRSDIWDLQLSLNNCNTFKRNCTILGTHYPEGTFY